MTKLRKIYCNSNFEQYDGFMVIECLAWFSKTKETKWLKFVIPNDKYDEFKIQQINFNEAKIQQIRDGLYVFPSYLKDNEVSDYYYDISVKCPQK